MRFATVLFVLAAAMAGCTGGTPPAAPPVEQAAVPAPAAAPEDVMEGVEMHLFEPSDDAPKQDEKPLLSIRADRVSGSMSGDAAELSFEGAKAVAQQKADKPPIYFEAARGRFQEKKRAVLEGGVRATIDDMTITLEEITWEVHAPEGTEGETGMAFSDKPLNISSPTQELEAARLRLYPDTQVMELYEVTGVINFKEIAP